MVDTDVAVVPASLPYTDEEIGELAVEQMHAAVKLVVSCPELIPIDGSEAFRHLQLSIAASSILANTFRMRSAAALERLAATQERSNHEARRRLELATRFDERNRARAALRAQLGLSTRPERAEQIDEALARLAKLDRALDDTPV